MLRGMREQRLGTWSISDRGIVMKKLQLELVRSVIGTPRWMRTIVQTLALRKLHHKVVVGDNPAIRGMVKKVPHLVELKEIEE